MEKHLKQIYGHKNFRPYQKEIIQDILNNLDVIVSLPTGGGKSLCYQFPATFLNKTTVVISPLISLMEDQTKKLLSLGIRTTCFNSSRKIQKKSLLNSSRNEDFGKYNIIYCTPEYFCSNIQVFKNIQSKICLIAIDEAHCMSEWGHDFRPKYKELKYIRKQFKEISIATFTATATPQVLEDIFDILDIEEANQYILGTKRNNLSIDIRNKSNNILEDLFLAKLQSKESTIIYTQTRKKVDEIHKILLSRNIRSTRYHAGMTMDERQKSHLDFINDTVQIIVATICFGMGIDKPDVRKIINYGAPCNIETYYQEIGRAGRDGLPSKVILFYNDSDFCINNFLISNSKNHSYKYKSLNMFKDYLINTRICRQNLIEHYFEYGNFDNKISNEDKCGICDNCNSLEKNKQDEIDITNEALLIINLIRSLNFNLGITKLINILRGSKNATIKNYSKNPFFSKGNHISIQVWKQIFNYIASKNYIQRKLYNKFTVLSLGKNKIGAKKLTLQLKDKNKNQNNKIYTNLKNIRDVIAYKNNIAPYMIINNKILLQISKNKPSTLEQLSLEDGINTNFVKNYGSRFLITKSRKNIPVTSTIEKTILYFSKGKNINQIAKLRNLECITIQNHIISYWSQNKIEIDEVRIKLTQYIKDKIQLAIDKVGLKKLRLIKDIVGPSISYFQIRTYILLKN